MDDKTRGLYNKFNVARSDGSSDIGGKHYGCEYFVLDMMHDKHAPAAINAYASSCAQEYPLLAADLRALYPAPPLPAVSDPSPPPQVTTTNSETATELAADPAAAGDLDALVRRLRSMARLWKSIDPPSVIMNEAADAIERLVWADTATQAAEAAERDAALYLSPSTRR